MQLLMYSIFFLRRILKCEADVRMMKMRIVQAWPSFMFQERGHVSIEESMLQLTWMHVDLAPTHIQLVYGGSESLGDVV